MERTAASKIIRTFMKNTNASKQLFNDKTTFGRSFKAWGAKRDFYETAAKLLEDHGYKTRIIKTPVRKSMWSIGGSYRIWVYE